MTRAAKIPCAVCATPTDRVNPPCNPPIWYAGTTSYPLCEKHGGIKVERRVWDRRKQEWVL